jgi:hypothetical protein
MRKYLFSFFILLPAVCNAQTKKTDTVKGVVIYSAPSNLRFISQGNYHTYTLEATLLRADTGIISIQTEYGYLDLTKNYEFIPMSKLQPARLKSKP